MSTAASAPASSPSRFRVVDLVRGLAIVGVVLYHLSWNLGYFGAIPWAVPMGAGGKGVARALALTFLFLVGVSLTLAHRHGFRAGPFWRRVLKLAVLAGVVSAGTAVAFPDSPVFFGILHAIAVFSVLSALFLRAPWWLVVAVAAGVALLPGGYHSAAFDSRWLAGTGLAEHPPLTVDLQPVFPRFAATLLGLLGGRLLLLPRSVRTLGAWSLHDPVSRFLVRCGRWSLWIYLLHQPVLYGLVWLAARASGGTLPPLWR